jgi:hypothetical protein
VGVVGLKINLPGGRERLSLSKSDLGEERKSASQLDWGVTERGKKRNEKRKREGKVVCER